MKYSLFVLPFLPFFIAAQTQIGADIEGSNFNYEVGASVSFSFDGTRIVIGAPYDLSAGDGAFEVFEESSGIWTQVGVTITGSSSSSLGTSVSISADGTRVAVGGARDDNSRGYTQIYEESNGTWTQVGTDIIGERFGDRSGESVSISSDGTRVAIGAPVNDGGGNSSGHVRIYEESGGIWTQVGADIDGEEPLDRLGTSVSLSSDGTRVAIGAPANDQNGIFLSGHVRVYEESGGTWTQVGADIDGIAAYDGLGTSVSISSNGSRIAASASGAFGQPGYFSIYEDIGGAWTNVSTISDDVTSGGTEAISISSDGTKVVTGSPVSNNFSGFARIYEDIGGAWTQVGATINGEAPSDRSGTSVSISPNGTRVAIGAPNNAGGTNSSGHVRVYDISSLLPIQLTSLTATATPKTTLLHFTTASESANRGFHLQHSPNGQNWTTLDFIPGAGDSQTERDYTYTHQNPVPGTNYYRLEQEDYDGTRTLSEVVTAEFGGVVALAVFPNPATDIVAITQTSESSAPYELRDSNGRTLIDLPATATEFSVVDLPAGIYLLRRVGERATVKVVVR